MPDNDFPDLDLDPGQQPDSGSGQGPIYGPPQGHGVDPVYAQYPPPRPTSQLAIWSLVTGCLGIFCCAVTAIPGIILGHMALGEIKRSGEQLEGRGLAIAGLVMSYVILLLVILYVLFIAFFASLPFFLDDFDLHNRNTPPRPEMTRPYTPSQPPDLPDPPRNSGQPGPPSSPDTTQPAPVGPGQSQGKPQAPEAPQ